MKLLNGAELAGFVKERQRKAVAGLDVEPRLSIVQCNDDPVINTYVKLKKQYGKDIGVAVDIRFMKQELIANYLQKANTDPAIHGIIIQLPLTDRSQTEEIVNLVAPEKDVDALGESPAFEPATPTAILWLLAGYNVNLMGKKILLIGRGKLVGAPLEKIFKDAGHNVTVADRETTNLPELALESDVIITAAGSPALLFPEMIKEGAVVVDAGVASEEGRIVGDVASEVYARDDLTITPVKGGVGPLTVCALFENTIQAASRSLE